MNNSWQTNNQTSPGFVYFSNNTPPTTTNKAESSDFLAFSDAQPSPKSSKFNPPNYSSPQHYQKGSPRNNYRGRPKQDNYFTQSSPNKNYNPKYNTSWNRNTNYDSKKHNQGKGDNNIFDKNKYLHPSFMEDPWSNLENNLNVKKQAL